MGIRDRIAQVGRQATNTLLDRIEGGLADLRAVRDADDIIDAAFEKADTSIRTAPTFAPNSGPAPVVPQSPPAHDPQALYWDPFALVEQLGYKEKPAPITYATLATMVWKVPIINAIIQTRINQVSSFTTPQTHRFDTGFRVRMRDREAKPSKQDKKFMKEMEDRILTTGWTDDPRQRDSFETFMRKITRDSLVYDQMCFEVVPGRDGKPSQWYAVDASTIRLADTFKLFPDQDPTRTKTVQIYDQVVIGEFTDAELAFGVRNPRTEIRSQGYGTSELEMMISTITHILWGLNYNANFFAQGSVAKGLLNLKGAIPEKQLRAFRRQWYQMIAGVENAWRTPIVNAEEIQWVNMQASNRDMEFSSWIDFLIKVATAIYQMDPIEVNFKYGSTGQKSMFDSANKAKLVESKDRGLKPLLRFLGRMIDKYIIWPINPDFMLEFVGLDSMTPKELADLNTQRTRSIYTVNEIRAENDMPPLPEGMGDLILDANWMAEKRSREERELQAAQQAVQLAMTSQGPDANAPGGVSAGKGAAGGVTSQMDKTLGGKVDGVKNSKQKKSSPATKKQQSELQSLLKPSTAEKSLDSRSVIVDLEF